jgi:iron complex outermembrane recepter protein
MGIGGVFMLKESVAFLGLIVSYDALAASADQPDKNPLKSLLDTRIYSASKKIENVYESPSSLYVITQNDLLRMNVRHIADALRVVPGLQVAKISSNKWMVAARGFGEQFSNKLLVLVDGRPVYTTLFSGVLWNQQDIPIVDIEQIEIIRGSGATLWGANAVNGVINILTKRADDVSSTNISITSGFAEHSDNTTVMEAQTSQTIQPAGNLRTTAKLRQDASYLSASKSPGYDDSWKAGSANFRYDTARNIDHSFNLSGSISANNSNDVHTYPTLSPPFSLTKNDDEKNVSSNIQGEWTEPLSENTNLRIYGYADYTDWQYTGYNPKFLNSRMEGQLNYKLFKTWDTISGMGYKLTADHIDNSQWLIYEPSSTIVHFFDAFFQTKVPIIEKQVELTLGVREETNSYDRFALSPNAKLAWMPSSYLMFWSSWGRAYRLPSRGTFDLTSRVAGTPNGYVTLFPSDDFKSEEVDTWETGLRANPFRGLSVDIVGFYSDSDNLRTFVPGPATGTQVAIARYIANSGSYENRGVEISTSYQTSPNFKIGFGYSYQDMDFALSDNAQDAVFLTSAGKSPQHTANINAYYSITDNLGWNIYAYYVDALPAINIPSRTAIDSNFSWNVTDHTELVAGIENITDNRHPEYSAQLFGINTEIPRLYYLTLRMSM